MKKGDYIQINRKAYDTLARHYRERHENLSEYEYSDESWREFLKKYVVANNTDILEIGPGDGRLLRIFEGLGCRTTAVELSKNMCEIAQEASPESVLINDDIKNVNFVDNSFDIVFAGALIHNFPSKDAKEVLLDMKNWVNKSGVIIIYTTLHSKGEEGYFEKEDYEEKVVRFRKKYTREEYDSLIASAGLKVVDEFFVDEKNRDKYWVVSVLQKNN